MPPVGTSTTLPAGTRVRLRFPHRADRPAIHALLGRLGLAVDDLDLARALRPDPRRRMVVLATTLIDRAEDVVGLGAMDRGGDEPDLLLTDERLAPGVGVLVAGALRRHDLRARRSA